MRVPIAYLNNGAIPLPRITDVDDAPEVIEHSERTAGGRLRSDVVAAKRQWSLSLRYLRQSEWRPIINHLSGLAWTGTTFWIDDFPGSPETFSVDALVRVERSERVGFHHPDTGWERNGRHLDLLIREV